MDAIITFLLDNWAGAIWMIIGGVIAWLCRGFKVKSDEAHTRLDKLPCDKHSEKINQVDVVNAKLDGITNMVQMLIQKNSGNNEIFQVQSPIGLTPYGIEIAKELEWSKRITDNWEVISNRIDENAESMNPYDIQQFCMNYIIANPEEILTEQGYDKLKLKAYEIGIPAITLLNGASLLIRDKYFDERNLDLGEIDAHTPIG